MGRTAIIYYHSIGGPPPQTLPLVRFRAHLECIRRHGFQTVSISELLGGVAPPRSVALVFDDGLLDNYTNALPLLLEFGMRATFYVVPGYDRVTRFVNPENGRWSDVPRPGYTIPFANMERSHRRELLAHGMEVGSHSYTHRMLTHIPTAEVRTEVRRSKAFLEDELGVPIHSFCYPKGRFNRLVIREVRDAGYHGACSTLPGYFHRGRNPYRLHRFLVEDPVFFEDVLVGKAFRVTTLAKQIGRRVGAVRATRASRHDSTP